MGCDVYEKNACRQFEKCIISKRFYLFNLNLYLISLKMQRYRPIWEVITLRLSIYVIRRISLFFFVLCISKTKD